jgi:hypothetical protein
MSINRSMHFGLPPSPDWNQLVRLSRFAGFALDVVLRRVLQAVAIVAGILCLFTWNGPREDQTLRRFDHDASAFKSALQSHLAQSRQRERDAQSPHHRQDLLNWLDRQSGLPLRVRLYEENKGFPAQLLFDSLPDAAAPSGPVWTHGISHRLVVNGRNLTADLSPLDLSRTDAAGNFGELALLLMMLGLSLLLSFALPQMIEAVVNLRQPQIANRCPNDSAA